VKKPICIYCKKEIDKRFHGKNLCRIVCTDCARKKRDTSYKNFLECLAPEQRTLFRDYERREGYATSMLILN